MSKEKEIKRINKVQIVGTLAEVGNLKYDETAEKEVTVNGEKKKIKGAITRADFKKPAFVVDVNGQMVGITTLPTYKKKVNDKGELVANERFKAMETIMEYEVGTRVKIDASISVGNPYKGKDGFVSVQMFNMSSTFNFPLIVIWSSFPSKAYFAILALIDDNFSIKYSLSSLLIVPSYKSPPKITISGL